MINVSRKNIRLEDVENEADCLLRKTGKDPTAGLPIAEERASSYDGRCQNLIVRIVKILQDLFNIGHNLI